MFHISTPYIILISKFRSSNKNTNLIDFSERYKFQQRNRRDTAQRTQYLLHILSFMGKFYDAKIYGIHSQFFVLLP